MSTCVVYIASSITGSGGVSRIMSEKVKAFKEKGITVCIVSTNDTTETCFYTDLHQAELVFYPHKVNHVGAIALYYKFVQTEVINKLNPSVVLVIDNGIKGYFAPYYLTKKVPVFFECHGSRNFLKLQTNNWFKQQLILGSTAVLSFLFKGIVILNSQSKKDWWGRSTRVIPNFITLANSQLPTSPILHKKIVAISRIAPEKNIETLLQVWEKIYAMHPTWELVICGGGDTAYFQTLQSKSIGVVWHGEVQDVSCFIEKADFLLHCSVMEGMPMVFLEAMSCGKPVIAFDVDFGPADLIQEGSNGFLVPKNDVAYCVQKVNELINDPSQIIEMGIEARKSLVRFEKDRIVKQWLTFFESL